MRVNCTIEGHRLIESESCADKTKMAVVVQESHAVNNYIDYYNDPGSSFLWIGTDHHFNRDEVQELVGYLNNWVQTGKLF